MVLFRSVALWPPGVERHYSPWDGSAALKKRTRATEASSAEESPRRQRGSDYSNASVEDESGHLQGMLSRAKITPTPPRQNATGNPLSSATISARNMPGASTAEGSKLITQPRASISMTALSLRPGAVQWQLWLHRSLHDSLESYGQWVSLKKHGRQL